jgi:hypothetical protein
MPSTSDVLKNIVDLLEPLSVDDRRRVVGGALSFFGDQATSNVPQPSLANSGAAAHSNESDSRFSVKAQVWMKQNGLGFEQIEQVFHWDGEGHADLIGELPGKSMKERTLAAYVLTGFANYLTTGEGSFDDEVARKISEKAGCFDAGNHAKFLKDKGNDLSGDKVKGWSLTAPGLKRAAALVKEMSTPKND